MDIELWPWALAWGGFLLGVGGILLSRHGSVLGRVVYLATFFLLGGAGFVEAVGRSDGLVPLGLSAGFLLVGLLWENPGPAEGFVIRPEEG